MQDVQLIDFDERLAPFWVQADKSGRRFVRPTGYDGAPTAEVVKVGGLWIATSWIMQPVRTMALTAAANLGEAIRRLEAAEVGGQHSPAWTLLPDLPASADASSCESCTPCFENGKPRRWAGFENGRGVEYIEVAGTGGGEKYLAVIENKPLASRNGSPILFETLGAALWAVVKETR